jgi:outer membrane protein assembly factor BamD
MRTKSVSPLILIPALLLVLFGLSCGPKAPKTVLDAEDQYAVARREFENKDWDQAVVELQKLIFNYPGVSFVDSAQYLLGMTYFNQEEYPLAIAEFNKVLISYPTSSLADDAAFMAAKSDFEISPKAELDQTHTQKDLQELNTFLEDYPKSDRTEEAQDLINACRAKLAKRAYRAGHLYLKMGHHAAALIYLKQILNEYHDTEWVEPAQFEIAEAFFKQKQFDKAKEEYQKFLRDFPNAKLAGKAKKRLKKLEKEMNADSG